MNVLSLYLWKLVVLFLNGCCTSCGRGRVVVFISVQILELQQAVHMNYVKFRLGYGSMASTFMFHYLDYTGSNWSCAFHQSCLTFSLVPLIHVKCMLFTNIK